ncbi:hypothetical protein MBLNU459_g1168t1 [Dothideomycetes sp. NU459]
MSAKALQRVQQCIERQAQHVKLNAFVSRPETARLIDDATAADARTSASPIHGRLVAVKDNIATSDLCTTAASKILGRYTSPFDATVVSTLLSNGAILAGKTNLDEFGMGSHSRSSFTFPVLNHLNRDGDALSPGGSSGGSAVAVATGQCWAALGTDTGGSVRLPAAYTGTVGFKPSYGRLSRWGVIAYANSLDTVGTLTQNVDDARKLFHCLDHYDPKDPTSLHRSTRSRIEKATSSRNAARIPTQSLRIGIPLEYNIDSLTPSMRKTWTRLLAALQSAGHSLYPVSLPATQQALSAYYVLAPAEASSNLAKYDGVRYGHRTPGTDASPSEELPLFAKTRGEGFGPEVQRRILLGAYTLSSEAMNNYFMQAQRVRRLVQRDFDAVFALPNPIHDGEVEAGSAQVDVLIAPTAPTPPPSLKAIEMQSPIESYMNDVLTVPASLAGLPALSVPVALNDTVEGHDVRTIGMQVIGQFGDDKLVLDIGEIIERMQMDQRA